MTIAKYKDLPCLACNTRGCEDIIEDGVFVSTFICTDCEGDGYLTAAQAEHQRGERIATANATIAAKAIKRIFAAQTGA